MHRYLTGWVLLLGAACGGPVVSPAPAVVRSGLEVAATDSLPSLRGLRVGLLTNQSGVDRQGRSGPELLRDAGVRLTALFSPEHGFRGSAAPGEHVESASDPATGLPIYSLYGRLTAPTPEMLAGVDVIMVDLQDVGARYFTWLHTTVEVMRAAGPLGKRVVVLDRPNPIGGAVEGPVTDPEWLSPVGLLRVPIRHGMTLGELALLARADLGLAVDLGVIPAAGWRRDMALDQTGLQFIAPSPNLQDLEALFHYPGTCLFEGTALSVGRGSDAPFRQIGAPWLDTAAVLHELRRVSTPGVTFRGVRFTPRNPGDGKYADTALVGIRFELTDRETYRPVATAVEVLTVIQRVHPERIGFNERGFDRLAGGPRLRESILAGRSPMAIVAGWEESVNDFVERRRPYVVYR